MRLTNQNQKDSFNSTQYGRSGKHLSILILLQFITTSNSTQDMTFIPIKPLRKVLHTYSNRQPFYHLGHGTEMGRERGRDGQRERQRRTDGESERKRDRGSGSGRERENLMTGQYQ